MKSFWFDQKESKLNIKKIVIVSLIAIILIAIAVTILTYCYNRELRLWIDKNILGKEIMQENTISIELDEENSKICAFNQYIGVLAKNNFKIYNSSGNEEKNLTMEITTPLFDTDNRFLAVAEDKGKKIYLVNNKDIAWEKEVEGNISQIKVNKNGYVTAVVTNTSYKTVIEMYTPEGEEMFKTYLSSTRTADVSVSNDNKYLAIAEIDISGTIIQSNIKIISIEKAQKDPTNSIEKIYSGEINKLITNIKYQDKNKLVCMYTDSIKIIENELEENLCSYDNKKITIASIELLNNAVTVEEKSSGLFTADSIINITNSDNKETKIYTIQDVTKEIYTHENIIAVNLGVEIEFINTSGWLVKKYIANQEITSLVVSNNIAGVVYRNKVDIIKL